MKHTDFCKRRKKNFGIEITDREQYGDERCCHEYSVSITHNGFQWMTQGFTRAELLRLVQDFTVLLAKENPDAKI